ncbi:MarR family winged helix-turn-helix transcriptional regulator [Modestobacter lapidis]|nr:winged helix-turn-helix transcriptional regulator [Modestobacter lapidis]
MERHEEPAEGGGTGMPAWVRNDPAGLPGYAVARAGAAMTALFARQLATVGLRPHTFFVLTHLARDPVLTSAELARRLQLTPQSMSELLRGMTDAGWVERSGGARRGQRIDLRLTDEGRAALLRAGPVLGALADPAVLGLTAAEAATLHGLLTRVLAAVTDHDRPPG